LGSYKVVEGCVGPDLDSLPAGSAADSLTREPRSIFTYYLGSLVRTFDNLGSLAKLASPKSSCLTTL
jgi:hypothetical protein